MKAHLAPGLLIGFLLMTSVAVGVSAETETTTSFEGVEYTVTFDKETEQIWIKANNPTDTTQDLYFDVAVDRMFNVSKDLEIHPGENRTFKFDLKRGVDVTRQEHNVVFTGGQELIKFTYVRHINSTTTENYPIPKITNITFETRMYGGESRSVINITAHNPSSRIWMPLIRAHTLETPGFYSPIHLGPNGTESTTILLRENAGELVAGEVRMYNGKISETTGAFDQVEIKGRSDDTVEWSHEEYKPVVPPWEDEDDYYVYENESVHREKVNAPETLKESPVAWIAGALVLVFGFMRVQKYRR